MDEGVNIGVCSWSLRCASPAELVERVRACGVRGVQVHLDPIREGAWSAADLGSRARVAGVALVSGMMSMRGEDYTTIETIRATGGVRPDATWEANLRRAEGDAVLAQRLGLSLVTFHAGFIPEGDDDPERARILERVRAVAEVFAGRGVRVALETGQESAGALARALREINDELPARWGVGVNFDPANMILYGAGDPVEAYRLLRTHVLQVHVKDARPPSRRGEWGTETVVGEGSVDWEGLASAYREGPAPRPALVIEREGGEDRVRDAATARELARRVFSRGARPPGAGA